MGRSRIREKKRRVTGAKRAGSPMELPILVFKIVSLIVVTGSFIIYLVNLPDSTAYFTARAESDSLTVTFGAGAQQAVAVVMDEGEEDMSKEDEPEAGLNEEG